MSGLRSLLPGGQRKLWHFHGGVHLPDEKTLSNGCPVAAAPLPTQLMLPLQQHIGAPARCRVSVGDKVLKGQLIAEPQGYISAPVHASSSGTVVAIESRPIPHPSGLSAPCVVIETDGEERWAELPAPLAASAAELDACDPAALRERIRASGIVGMGGASFPTNVKLNPGKDQPIDTVVINGAECEPYITCDDLLMRERAADIVDGVRVMLHLVQAKRALIGVEDNKPDAAAALNRAIADAGVDDRVEVVVIPTLYPSGGEKQLIRILTGKEVPSHGIPAQIGIVCQNVGTAAAVADAVLRGQPLIERLVTVTGRGVVEPRNYRVPIGISAEALIAASGGYRGELAKLVAGGPMMGFRLDTDLVPITKATNCLLALTPEESPDPGAPLPCIRCGRCAEVCPANLLPQQLYWHARAKELDKVQDYNLFDCIECGCCAHVCPSHIPLVQYYRFAKTESWAREQEKRAADHARERHAAREARLERQERERKAKLRKKKEAVAAGGTKPAAAGAKPAAGGAKPAVGGAKSAPAGAQSTADAKAKSEAATAATEDRADKQALIEAARRRAAEKKAMLAKAQETTAPPADQDASAQDDAAATTKRAQPREAVVADQE
ncbi:electron transport complex subunit RsxC [Halochromatium roseum]|uniref:electron transport complex subunit RsxC n=1 Tax=Halochromatium roseum TaxID=391920 RepID=UPI001911C255|nr:electron transport complex subunit RsxC [Halochromatium roseum]MBK5941885.1 electron transport complex subunit RsxC [Halochromatium roseum]